MPKEKCNSDNQYITVVVAEINRFLSDEEKAALNRQLYRIIIQDPDDEYRVCIRTTIGTTQYRPIRQISGSPYDREINRSLIVDSVDKI